MHKGVGLGNLRERSNFEDLLVKSRMYCMEICWDREECIDQAEDWDKYWAAVHMVMNTRGV